MLLIKKICFGVVLTSLMLTLSLPAMGLKDDSQQPIQINSTKQLVDLKKTLLCL